MPLRPGNTRQEFSITPASSGASDDVRLGGAGVGLGAEFDAGFGTGRVDVGAGRVDVGAGRVDVGAGRCGTETHAAIAELNVNNAK